MVDTSFWIFGKKVLLPVGRADINTYEKRVYAKGLTKQQVEDLPNFDDLDKIDYDQEEQVRNVYRPTAVSTGTKPTTAYDRDTYDYDRDPDLFHLNKQNQQSLKLYEERLVADKQRQKTGEAVIGKQIETEQAQVSVPVEKERVVIERTAPTDRTTVDPNQADFREGEVARMEGYEETPDIHKEAVVHEEVHVRKEVEHDTVNAEETSCCKTINCLVVKEILVINVSGEIVTLTEEELADGVQVTGEVQRLVTADLEREYGLDLDPDLYAEYEDQPVIVAQAIALAPDPADVTANPEAFYNQTIAVEADIEEFLSPRIFKLDEDQFFGGQGLLVLSNVAELTEVALEVGQIEEGDVVVVTGVLRPFVRADFERDHDFAWDEGTVAELEAEYTNVPVLVANEIYPAAQ